MLTFKQFIKEDEEEVVVGRGHNIRWHTRTPRR